MESKKHLKIEALIAEYRQSGTSVVDFAAERKIGRSTLFSYLRQYSKTRKPLKTKHCCSLKKPQAKFLPVEIASTNSYSKNITTEATEFVVAKQGNWELAIPVGTNPDWLSCIFGGGK